MGVGTSNFVIRWINFFTMLLAIAIISFGVWMSTHHDSCRRSLCHVKWIHNALSIIGFLGALKNNSILLWVINEIEKLLSLASHIRLLLWYERDNPTNPRLNLLKNSDRYCLFGIFYVDARFIITNNGSGHSAPGLRYKEYQLHDYSSWFLKQLNNTHNWKHLKSCLVKTDDCNALSRKYKTLKQFKSAELTPIEAGCCRPPSVCGYPLVNASYYDLSFRPVSSNKDCKLYKNNRAIKCYNCDSCKAGVTQYMKTEWRVVAIFNVILFVILSVIYLIGCCARRNASRSLSKA